MSCEPASGGDSEGRVPPRGPLWLLAELTYTCPLQCPYCSNPVDFARRREELTTAEWLSTLEQGREMGAVQLGFSGGEPALRRDLEALVSGARALGYYTNLITSGLGLDEARIARLREAGLDHIQVSFQAAEPELNDRIAGTRCYAHKLEIARAVKGAGLPMVLNFVLYRENLHQIEAMLELADELEADQVELANTQYYGWALRNRARLLPSRAQLEEAEARVDAFRARLTRPMKVIFVVPDYYSDRPKACMNGWGTTFLSISPDGTALPCHAAASLPGLELPNVREHRLRWIWEDSPAFNRFRGEDWMRAPCRTCPERSRDFGGCRCQAWLLTGDPANADPVCRLSPARQSIDDAIAAASDPGALDVPFVYRNTRASRAFAEGAADTGRRS